MDFEIARRPIYPGDPPGARFSEVSIDGVPFCVALDPGVLPIGDYHLLPYESPKHGPTVCFHNPDLGIRAFTLSEPTDHDYIEIHAGNWVRDSLGCVLVGREVAMIEGELGITASGETFQKLIAILGDRIGHTATIQESP
jgi:hypothetical protein